MVYQYKTHNKSYDFETSFLPGKEKMTEFGKEGKKIVRQISTKGKGRHKKEKTRNSR